jgi:cation diffusion facilitator CzcD-associated flavoprotein CzcO
MRPGARGVGPEDLDGFAHWREILRVVEHYAASTDAPVREHTEVTELRASDGEFEISVPDATIYARHVVGATGPFQRPRFPRLAEGSGPSLHETAAKRRFFFWAGANLRNIQALGT